jgi:signal transduction histidine kinase
MKTLLTAIWPENAEKFSGLHQLADCLVNSFLLRDTSNKSFFFNEIPDRLYLETDQEMLASVLSGLLSAVASHTEDSCIHLSAKTYGNVVLVKVKDSSGLNIDAVESEVCKLQPLAEKMRGSVSVTSQRKKLTTITFGFPNLPLP